MCFFLSCKLYYLTFAQYEIVISQINRGHISGVRSKISLNTITKVFSKNANSIIGIDIQGHTKEIDIQGNNVNVLSGGNNTTTSTNQFMVHLLLVKTLMIWVKIKQLLLILIMY
jgi:hypothetical protein